VPLVNLIGISYQIRDDYMNLASAKYSANKGLCEDLTEGKFSFPVIHSIRSNPQNRQLLNILKLKPKDDDVKKYAVSYMQSTKSFEYTIQKLQSLLVKGKKLVEKIDDGRGQGKGVLQILEKLDVDQSIVAGEKVWFATGS
jgi:geranylgeranyl diphosphate synthase type 3